MDPNKEIEMLGQVADRNAEEGVSVDEFIKELEAKEKDLHITSDANVIEISEDLDEELPEFMKGDFEFAPADEPLVSAAPSKPKHDKRASKLEIEIAEL